MYTNAGLLSYDAGHGYELISSAGMADKRNSWAVLQLDFYLSQVPDQERSLSILVNATGCII